MKIELDLPEVPGYEYTGEYRSPKLDEPFKAGAGVRFGSGGMSAEFPILKKKAPKYSVIGEGHALFKTYVEIKALEDLIKLAQTDIESMSNAQCREWDAIVDLIK